MSAESLNLWNTKKLEEVIEERGKMTSKMGKFVNIVTSCFTVLSYSGGTVKAFKREQDARPSEWEIVDLRGKITLRHCERNQYVRARRDGIVDLVDSPREWEMWTPFLNDDKSYSLLSYHGNWMSVQPNGTVGLIDRKESWEKFFIIDPYE